MHQPGGRGCIVPRAPLETLALAVCRGSVHAGAAKLRPRLAACPHTDEPVCDKLTALRLAGGQPCSESPSFGSFANSARSQAQPAGCQGTKLAKSLLRLVVLAALARWADHGDHLQPKAWCGTVCDRVTDRRNILACARRPKWPESCRRLQTACCCVFYAYSAFIGWTIVAGGPCASSMFNVDR